VLDLPREGSSKADGECKWLKLDRVIFRARLPVGHRSNVGAFPRPTTPDAVIVTAPTSAENVAYSEIGHGSLAET
jgi:hypothetical protein